MKSMIDDDVVDYLLVVKAWLSERLGPPYETVPSSSSLGSTTTATKWSIDTTPIFGKFHTWSMHYLITISDDTVAVEFALVKDTL